MPVGSGSPPRRPATPDGRRRRRPPATRAPGRAPTDRSRPPAGRRSRCRRSAGRSPARRLDAHRRDRPGDAGEGRRRPAVRRAATAAGEVNTPPARQRQAGGRSRTMTSRPAARAGARRSRRPAPDDRDVDRARRDRPSRSRAAYPREVLHGRGRRGQGHAVPERSADPTTPPGGPRPDQGRSRPRVYARRTDSGASCRVYRFRVARWPISHAPIQPAGPG